MANYAHWRFERAVILALAAPAIAVAAMGATLFVLHVLLPADDLARGGPVFTTPVLEFGLMYALAAAAIAWPCMLWGLWRTALHRSLPVVAATAVIAVPAGVAGLGFGCGLGCGFLAAVAAMAFCRRRYRDPL